MAALPQEQRPREPGPLAIYDDRTRQLDLLFLSLFWPRLAGPRHRYVVPVELLRELAEAGQPLVIECESPASLKVDAMRPPMG